MDMQNGSNQLQTRVSAGEQQGFDIVRVLWRWKLLPILGALIGIAIGYLSYTQQPPQYIASALVQVVSPVPTSNRIQPYSPEDVVQYNRQDESLVISSERVLKMAGEKLKGSVSGNKLAGMDANAIAGWIASSRKLVVAPAAKDSNTTLINISFVCDDRELSSLVVNAVVSGYSDYLSEEYRTIGDQIYALMMEAQDKVASSFRELRKEAADAKAKVDMPIVWTDNGSAVNPFAINLQDLNSKLAALAVERNSLQAKLQRAQQAIKNKQDPGAILLWLSDDELLDVNAPPTAANNALSANLAKQQLESERMERQDLFRLQAEEQRYLSSVGESHPRLASVRQQIALLKQQIVSVREAERAEAAKVNEALSEMKKKEDEVVVFKPLTASERLGIRLNAMQEALASLAIEEEGLNKMAQENEESSKKLSMAIQDVEYLNRELEQVKSLQEAYVEKIRQLQLRPKDSQRSLKELNLPTMGSLYGPKLMPYLSGGGAIGFLLMAGLAILFDLADKSFRSAEDIAMEVGAPVLGHIPAMEIDKVVKRPNQPVDSSLCTIHHSRGRVSEAYRSVRTGLFFSNRGGDLKVIQVTSPVPGDGKSTLSSNLAVTMAQSGRSVLLIDADFRRPRIAKLFSIDSEKGMATVVAGACELDDAIHVSSIPGLSVMPGGKRPSNPAELLSSQRFADLLGVLREKFDMIIVDTPPLLAVSDPSAIAAVVDGVVLTMRLRRNVKPLVTRAAHILESVDANLLGIVVNGVSQEAGYGYSYGYRDYRYAYQYRYGYGYKGYGQDGYGSKKYLEESHDVDTDHVLTQSNSTPDLGTNEDRS